LKYSKIWSSGYFRQQYSYRRNGAEHVLVVFQRGQSAAVLALSATVIAGLLGSLYGRGRKPNSPIACSRRRWRRMEDVAVRRLCDQLP
jgi:hypothetical protein